MKGIIALDLDGTTVVYGHPIANEVVEFLNNLVHDQWTIMFITGRTLKSSDKILKQLPFPFYLAVQNGAIIMEMPSKQIVDKKYLDIQVLPTMQQICDEANTGFIIYSGCENQDICYYRQHSFPENMMQYLKRRAKSFDETWLELPSLNHLDIDQFSSVKCIGTPQAATAIAQQIEQRLGLHVPLIRDPFNEEYWVAQATHPEVDKGKALRSLCNRIGNTGVIIAAGDDNNDYTMFKSANIKVAMATAPHEIIALADVVAPPADKNGLIAGLSTAIRLNL